MFRVAASSSSALTPGQLAGLSTEQLATEYARLLAENESMRAAGAQLENQVQGLALRVEQQAHAAVAAAAAPVQQPAGGLSAAGTGNTAMVNARLKGPTLKQFNGAMGFEVDGWIKTVIKQIDFLGPQYFPTDDHKVKYAALFLDGAASDWWDGEKESVHTWAEFLERLYARYRPKLAAEVARAQLSQLRQRAGVSALCNKMLQLLVYVPKMHEEDRIFLFKQALDKQIAARVAEKQPTTLPEAMDIAVQAELYVGGRANSQYGGVSFSKFNGSRQGHTDSTPMEVSNIEETDESKEEPENGNAPPGMQQLLAMVQDLKVQQHALAATFQKRNSSNGSSRSSSSSGGKVPGVSKEEYERCRRENLCIKCKKPGHIASNCTSKSVHPLKW